jgi:phage baseplate assembly protein W
MATSFGKDTSCTTSLRTGRYASGVQLVAEACFRRLITPRGTLRGGENEANYGLDLTAYIGTTNPRSLESKLASLIAAELKKDERVDTVVAEVTATKSGIETTLTIEVTVETGEGPFTLNLAVDGVSTQLLGIES